MRHLAIAALLAGIGPAAGQPPPFPTVAIPSTGTLDPKVVSPLVEQLASPDFRVREKAGRELLALGDRGLPALKAMLPIVADAEANRRLQVIVEKLDGNRLRNARERSAPTGVCGSDNMRIRVCEEDRRAVCGQNAERNAALVRREGIGLRIVGDLPRGAHDDRLRAVYLIKSDERCVGR